MSPFRFQAFFVSLCGESNPPPEAFTTETIFSPAFWEKIGLLEQEVSGRLGREVRYDSVIASEDIPAWGVSKGDVVVKRMF